MSRLCEICGAPIGDLAGICQSCGVSHDALNAGETIMVGQPRWGVIMIELPTQPAEASSAIAALRATWGALEESGFQKLAPSQLHLINFGRSSLELVGPYSSFKKIQEDLEGQLKVDFLDKKPSEVDDLLGRVSVLSR
ncbi:hypothetical protein [Eleftheria terrae]|uniref:hypothetical protein n=1 Tax=Eleftheria terrae TaxID=1597781 RepID=UPI00263A8978|nr:hypothetical protein [Eleftheria terrae]WKB55623.1 hypothetical protein N7L95_26480 [Eleftheria terrae]